MSTDPETEAGYVFLTHEPVLTNAHGLEELVFQALGAASVCWEKIEAAGVFDSDRAKAIGDELVGRIQELIDDAVLTERVESTKEHDD